MSDDDDDLGGDEDQLKQLRAVWVSMRDSDEDPPDRGLDALMAAARDKAAGMAPAPSESWWQKVIAVLRRPPVLALATITVLLGGALVIAQRKDEMKSESHVTPEYERANGGARPAKDEPQAGSAMPPAIVIDAVDAGVAMATGQGVTPAPTPVETPAPPKPTPEKKPVPPRQRPQSATQAEKAPPATPATPDVATPQEPVAGLVPAKPDPAPAPGTTSLQIATDNSEIKPVTRGPTVKKPADKPAGGENQDLAKTKTDDEAEEAVPDKSRRIDQLIKQCESAAARNDCTATKVLAKQIKSEDARAYASRVAKNAQIARCLE